MNDKKEALVKRTGSLGGLFIATAVGFAMYFGLNAVQGAGSWFPYDHVVERAGSNTFYKLVWFVMNFTEAEFYAGVLASLGVILGGVVAWQLDVRKSKLAGFDICYGTNLFLWVLGSQLLSLAIAIFVLNYTQLFDTGDYGWLPTFISVVGVPPSVMLVYGPSVPALLTGSILGGLVSFPVGFLLMETLVPLFEIPGVVANVFTMALTGIVVMKTCHALPWMKKVPPPTIEKQQPAVDKETKAARMRTPAWFMRRVLADFTEAQFYGNEVAAIFLLVGVSIDWLLNSGHAAYGSGTLPAMILSQFVAAGVGIWLYTDKYAEQGWYATFVPVVSVGPACVLVFGATIPVALFSGVVGGIIGGPVAEYLVGILPDDMHPTVGNTASMGICTIVTAVVMQVLPFF